MTEPWKLEEVAKAQRALVEKQLEFPLTVAPLKAFVETMRELRLWGERTLLDVGCGVGHYGVICGRFFPLIKYSGVDFSPAMIEQAREVCQDGTFRVKPFFDTSFRDYDIVLVAQVMEYQDDPFAALAHLLKGKHRGYVILHRLRLTESPSHRIASELCYCGHSGQNYEWNTSELIAFIGEHSGLVKRFDKWDNSATIVVVDKE